MPYHPTPWGQSMKTFGWEMDDDIDVPVTPDMTFVRPAQTRGGELRLDSPNRLGMMNRRGWGYGCDVKYATSGNTDTP